MSAGWVHASAVIVGEAGVVLFGASGAGKSTVARLLLDRARGAGRFARLVGDDKVALEARHNRLVVRAHPEIAGRMEVRGLGILPVPHEMTAVARLAVRLEPEVPRLPEPGETTVLASIAVPLLRIRQGDARAADLIFAALAARGLLPGGGAMRR